MFRKLSALAFLIYLVISPVHGAGDLTGLMGAGGKIAVASGGGGCSQYTTLAGRYSSAGGSLTSQEASAMQTMVCGLVSDGIITGTMAGSGSGASACGSLLDGLYIFAVNNKTNANLNLCSTSYGLVEHPSGVSATFTADVGYTGAGGGDYFDPVFNPTTAAGNFALNSASIGVFDQTNRTTSASEIAMGGHDATNYAYVELLITSSGLEIFYDMNAANFPGVANTTTRGAWVITRTASNSLAVYRNGSTTPFTTSSGASAALLNQSIFIFGLNNNGSPTNTTVDQLSAAYLGAGLTATQAAALMNRINAYLASNGAHNLY